MERLRIDGQRQNHLSVAASPQDSTYRVTPVGAVDIASVPELEAAIQQGEDSGASRVVVDLRGVTFIDSTGVRCLIAAHRYSRTNGRKLRIVPGGPQVQKVFEIGGLLQELPFAAE